MRIVKPSFEILSDTGVDTIIAELKKIELAGRNCYKSEDKICEGSHDKMIGMLRSKKHFSVLEHGNITVRMIGSRAFSHQLVRHRLASYSQESQRYVRLCAPLSKNPDMTEKEAIDLYQSGLSMKKVSTLSSGKYTEWQIYKMLDSNDIPKRVKGSRGLLNDNFFESIDTPEKAYLLGFIQADGSIDVGKNQLSITQKNGWFIKKIIEDFIKPNIHTSKDRECDRFNIYSNKLISDLIKNGIIVNKTYAMDKSDAEKLWSSIPSDLKYDFLRGMLDGDGNIRFFNQSNKGETFSCNIGWSGNQYLIEVISKFFKEDLGYTATVRQDSDSAILYRVAVTKPDIGLELCKKMYKNFIFPYGHPVKTIRGTEHINHDFKVTDIETKKRFEFICPIAIYGQPTMWTFVESMETSADSYESLIKGGMKAEDARGVLPNQCKTEVVVTMNLRSWMHFFSMRCDKHAQSEIRLIALGLLEEFYSLMPVIFSDLAKEYLDLKEDKE